MKYFCVIIGWLLASGSTLAADDAATVSVMKETFGIYNRNLPPDKQNRISFEWKVPLATWRQAPAWSPEEGPVPLDAHAAAAAARQWLKAQPWADHFEKFTAIDLSNYRGALRRSPEDDTLWFYKLSFTVKDNQRLGAPSLTIVLFDGTGLEPILVLPDPGQGHK